MGKIFIGVDLHKKQFTVCFMNEDSETKTAMYSTDTAGYELFISQLKMCIDDGFELSLAVESTGNTRFFRKRITDSTGLNVVVINTMKFKVVNESINKTDKRDAKTIAEFLQKDVLPEAKLCSEKSEMLRRIISIRKTLVSTKVKLKNQIHGILLGMGIETKSGQLNSKKGRSNIINIVSTTDNRILVELLVNNIEDIEKNIKQLEAEMDKLTENDRVVEILKSISGTGSICAITVRAFIDDINRFDDYKKLSSYAGLVPWVKCSDKKTYYGNITKRGPSDLRSALVQMVLGMVRCKMEHNNILMLKYRDIKKQKGSGKALIAVARKFTKLIWTLLKNNELYDKDKMSKERFYEKIFSMQEHSSEEISA